MDDQSRTLRRAIALTNALRPAHLPVATTEEERADLLVGMTLWNHLRYRDLAIERSQLPDAEHVAQRIHVLLYAAKPESDHEGSFWACPGQQVLLCKRLEGPTGAEHRQRRILNVAKHVLPVDVREYDAVERVVARFCDRLFDKESMRAASMHEAHHFDMPVLHQAPVGVDPPVKRFEAYVVMRFSAAATIKPESAGEGGRKQFGFRWCDVADVEVGKKRLRRRERDVVVGFGDYRVVGPMFETYDACKGHVVTIMEEKAKVKAEAEAKVDGKAHGTEDEKDDGRDCKKDAVTDDDATIVGSDDGDD
ncbi:hypothetical protein LTR85_000838 [Meristemomyces frigidus]|nr:hypothetical protein LTR85_000838 [Meristemomyces frigidus]